MNVELITGEPVAAPSHKNTYELVVDYMHGDADGDTMKTEHYTDVEYLKAMLAGLNYMAEKQHASRNEWHEVDMEEFFQVEGVDDPEEKAASFSDFYEGDITCEGRAAAVVGFTVFYYDDRSVKHHVTVKIDGTEA